MSKILNVAIIIFAFLLLCVMFLYFSGLIDIFLTPHEYKGVFVTIGGCS